MNDGTPHLEICLLGAPEIQISGQPLSLNHLKARALLFFLAASGQAHTRQYLAALLWGEAASGKALHSLRSSLYRLRQSLRPHQLVSALLSEGELLGLQPASYQCDLIEFRRLLAQDGEEPLTQAVALYRGPFLQGFSLTDAPLFEEWVRAEELRLNQACLGALDQLAARAEARHDWTSAAAHLQQMIQLDPLAEMPQQRLIGLYLRQGEISLALRQYYFFEDRLQQELNLAPSTEMRALLYAALRQQRQPAALTAPPGPAGRPSSAQLRQLPFTGRDRLLQQLASICQEVQAGHGATVLLQGEGGIGKSRLLDELSSGLISASPPWILLQGACSPFDDPLSYGPFLDALQNGLPGNPAAWMQPGDDSSDAGGRFSWGFMQTMRLLARSAPLLLAIEDLHWANSSTLNLFGLLSMRIHHLPVLLVGTVQHAEAIPALQRLITLGRRRGELHLLSLSPLTREDIAALLQASGLDAPSADTLVAWLHARSTGNPFLLAEILAQLRAEAILLPVGEGWQLDTIRWLRWRTTFNLPETAHDLVAWRLSNLSPQSRHLLYVLAVAGQPLPLSILRQFPGIQGEALPSLVDDLANRGLIVEPPGAALALPHHLLRETLLHHLSDLRRRTLHQQLAQALEVYASSAKTSSSDAWSRQVALHAVAGENLQLARAYGLRLLDGPPPEYFGAEAVDFAHHLYDLLAPSASSAEMVRLTRAIGRLHQSLGHLEIAARWHSQNLTWAQKIGDSAALAEAHFEMGELALMSNDYKLAAQAAQKGMARLNEDNPALSPASYAFNALSGRAHRLLGAAFAMEGSRLDAAEEHLQAAVAAHRRAENQGELCAGLFELGNIAAQRGELARALDFYAESARAAEAGRIHYYHALAHNNFAYHSLLLGQVDAAQQAVAQGLKVAEANDLVTALLHLYSTQGEIQLYLAEWSQARLSFQHGLALAEDLGSLERQAGYRGGLALAARGEDDPASALQLLEEALALIAGQGYWHLHTRLQLWLAETQFEQGHIAQSGESLAAATSIASAQQRGLLFVQAERLRASLLAAGGDWSAANALFAETLRRVDAMELPLEAALLKAAWGEAALRYSPTPEQGRSLIADARAFLLAHGARAALAVLPIA
jgi:DNA-binding SARP family transcriptional activator/predicted ATPase